MRICVHVLLAILVLGTSPRAWAQAPDASDADLPVFRALERVVRDPSQPKTDRLSAAGNLAKAAHPSVVPTLLALLRDPDVELRSAGAVSLGWQGNRAAVEPLIERASHPAEDAKVRIAAVRSLGKIGDPSAVPAMQGVAREPAAQMRREALLVLIESRLSVHADRVSAAIALVEDVEQDGHVRSRAASRLAAEHDARAVEPLIRVLQDVRPPAGFSELPAPERMTGQPKVMAERLRSLHAVRAHAAHALGYLGDQRAAPSLLAALSDADPLVRMQSAGALARLKAPGAVTALIGAVADPDPRVRALAVGALGALCDPDAGPALRRAIDDQEGIVRERVSTALGRLGYEAARPDLLRLAEEDPVPRVREKARAALRRLDSGRACQ
jgi:HEAT repeat protein